MTLRAQAAAGVKWTTLASGIIVVSEVLRTIVLARFLYPIDFGLMAMVTVVVGFAQMYTDVGISAAIIHRQDSTKAQLSSLYWLNIFAGWVMFVLFWLCTPLITKFYGEPGLPPLLHAVGIVFLITPICSQFEILLQKELLFDALAKRDIGASVGQTCVAIVLAVLGFGVWAMVYGFLIAAVLRVALLLHVGFTQFRPSFHFKWSDLKGYLGFGLFQIGERSAYYLSQRFDQLLIGCFLGATALGYYSFAFNLAAQPLSRINPALTKVAFPVFSKVQDDPVRLRRGYMKLVGIVTAFNAPLLIGLAAVAPWAVPAIFGPRWSESIVLVQLLSLVILLRSINNPIGSLQYAKGRADLGFVWHVISLVFSVPVIYFGCLLGQPASVAGGLLLLQISLSVPIYILLIKPLIGKCARDYTEVTLKPIAAASVMALGVLALSKPLHVLPIEVLLAIQIVFGGLVYLILLRGFHNEVLVDIVSAARSR